MDENTRTIELTQGFVAVVDAADYEWLSAYSWTILKTKDGKLYARRKGKKESGEPTAVLMHRFILGVHLSGYPWVDHRDGNGLRNTRENIRLATASENGYNKVDPRTAIKVGGYVGVKLTPQGLWEASIAADKTRYVLGNWDSAEKAALAHDCGAKYLHGDFAVYNLDIAASIPKSPSQLRNEARAEKLAKRASENLNITYDRRHNKWTVQVSVDHKNNYCGQWGSEAEAAIAADAAVNYLASDRPWRNRPDLVVEALSPMELKQRSRSGDPIRCAPRL